MLKSKATAMVFGGGAFRQCLGHEDKALMNGITPYKTGSRETLDPFYHVRLQWKVPSRKQKVPYYWELQKKTQLNRDYIMIMDWKIQYHREEL